MTSNPYEVAVAALKALEVWDYTSKDESGDAVFVSAGLAARVVAKDGSVIVVAFSDHTNNRQVLSLFLPAAPYPDGADDYRWYGAEDRWAKDAPLSALKDTWMVVDALEGINPNVPSALEWLEVHKEEAVEEEWAELAHHVQQAKDAAGGNAAIAAAIDFLVRRVRARADKRGVSLNTRHRRMRGIKHQLRRLADKLESQ